MPITRRSASAVIAGTIIAAGFFGASFVTDGATPAAGDACSCLAKADAAAALDEAANGPKMTATQSMGPDSTASSCEYAGSGYKVVHINLMRLSPDTAAMYKMFCAEKGKEGLSGLGDVTCWYDKKHEELQVLQGTTFISIEPRGLGNPTEAIKGVAKKVFDRPP